MSTDYNLTSSDELTTLITNKNIFTWSALTNYIKQLPYGRNKNRTDLSLVIIENKGSCSSKHALLKQIADLNNIPNVSLILGIYKMSSFNTPKIKNTLTKNFLDYIPEAHCYLKIGDERVDFTTITSSFLTIKKDVIQEEEITPDQVSTYKVSYHKQFLKQWLSKKHINFSFDELWEIREQCIHNLSK